MDSFLEFYKESVLKPSEGSRTHHQSLNRGMNRKHLYMVAKSHGLQMQNSIVELFLKDQRPIRHLTSTEALKILKTYHIKHTPENSYSKSINRTGVRINFDANSKKWKLVKLGK